jgi:hypothetical protein
MHMAAHMLRRFGYGQSVYIFRQMGSSPRTSNIAKAGRKTTLV